MITRLMGGVLIIFGLYLAFTMIQLVWWACLIFAEWGR
jgi:hypothetical protein